MVLPLFGILLVAVNITVLLVLVTVAKGITKRNPPQADFPELTGLVRGQKAKSAPSWSRARSSLARTSSRGRLLPPFGRLRASLCIPGSSSSGEQSPRLSIHCSTYLPRKGLLSAHSWPPSNGGPSHAGSRVLQPPNMQMTWSFPPRMLAALPLLPPAGPRQQLRASQQGSVDIMRHLYKLHFGRSSTDPGSNEFSIQAAKATAEPCCSFSETELNAAGTEPAAPMAVRPLQTAGCRNAVEAATLTSVISCPASSACDDAAHQGHAGQALDIHRPGRSFDVAFESLLATPVSTLMLAGLPRDLPQADSQSTQDMLPV